MKLPEFGSLVLTRRMTQLNVLNFLCGFSFHIRDGAVYEAEKLPISISFLADSILPGKERLLEQIPESIC